MCYLKITLKILKEIVQKNNFLYIIEENQFATPQFLVSHLESEAKKLLFIKKTLQFSFSSIDVCIGRNYFFLNSTLLEFALSLTEGWAWFLMLGDFMLVTSYTEKMALSTHDKNKQ